MMTEFTCNKLGSMPISIRVGHVTDTATFVSSTTTSSFPSRYDFAQWNEIHLFRTVLQAEIQDDSDTLRRLAHRLLAIKDSFEDVHRLANAIQSGISVQPNISTYMAERGRVQVRFREKEIEWLSHNYSRYQGEWVIVEGDELIGAGEDPSVVLATARQKGIAIPFLVFIPLKEEAAFMGL